MGSWGCLQIVLATCSSERQDWLCGPSKLLSEQHDQEPVGPMAQIKRPGGAAPSSLHGPQSTPHRFTDEATTIRHGPHLLVISGVQPDAERRLGQRLIALDLELMLPQVLRAAHAGWRVYA